MKSVVLLGKGELACRIGAWFLRSDEHELRCVVPSMPEPTWTQSLPEWCREHRVPLIESGDVRDIPGVNCDDWSVDILLSVFYSRIVPAWIFNKAAHPLNLHNAPLPRYRGVAPINWALKNGEREHGVTIHRLSSAVDAGPIVAQVKFSIFPDTDEVITVYRRALAFGYMLFEQTIAIIDDIQPIPQAEEHVLSYSRRDMDRLGDRRDFRRSLCVTSAANCRDRA